MTEEEKTKIVRWLYELQRHDAGIYPWKVAEYTAETWGIPLDSAMECVMIHIRNVIDSGLRAERGANV